MRKSDLESLIDLMGGPRPSDDDDAPKTQSLLRPVEEMAGAAPSLAGAGREDEESGWFDGAATPKLPLEGGIRVEADKPKPGNRFGEFYNRVATAHTLENGDTTVEVNSTMPQRGPILPVGSVRGMGDGPANGVDPHVLRGLVAKPKSARTDGDLDTTISLAYTLERLKERDPQAFEKLPKDTRLFFKSFGDKMLEARGAIMPTDRNPTHRLPAAKWNEIKKDAARSALDSAYGNVIGTTFTKGIADTVPQLAGGANLLFNAEWLKNFEEKAREWNESKFGVPEEYKGNESLYWAELAGNIAGTIVLGMTPSGAVKAVGAAAKMAGKIPANADLAVIAGQKTAQYATAGREALMKVTPEMAKEAMDKTLMIIGKLRKMTPGAFDTISSTITGGDVHHKLKENGLSDGQARGGGALAMAASAWGPMAIANIVKSAGVAPNFARGLAMVARHKPVSAAYGSLISKFAEELSEPSRRSAGGSARSTLGPVEELRRLMIDG